MCTPLNLYILWHVCRSIRASICLSVCLYTSLRSSLNLSTCLFDCLTVCPLICLHFNVPISIFVAVWNSAFYFCLIVFECLKCLIFCPFQHPFPMASICLVSFIWLLPANWMACLCFYLIYFIYSHLISFILISFHLFSFLLIFLIFSHLCSSHFFSSPLISSLLISSHFSSLFSFVLISALLFLSLLISPLSSHFFSYPLFSSYLFSSPLFLSLLISYHFFSFLFFSSLLFLLCISESRTIFCWCGPARHGHRSFIRYGTVRYGVIWCNKSHSESHLNVFWIISHWLWYRIRIAEMLRWA